MSNTQPESAQTTDDSLVNVNGFNVNTMQKSTKQGTPNDKTKRKVPVPLLNVEKMYNELEQQKELLIKEKLSNNAKQEEIIKQTEQCNAKIKQLQQKKLALKKAQAQIEDRQQILTREIHNVVLKLKTLKTKSTNFEEEIKQIKNSPRVPPLKLSRSSSLILRDASKTRKIRLTPTAKSARKRRTQSLASYDLSYKTLRGHDNGVLCVHVVNDSNYVISGGVDQTIRLWNLKSNKPVCKKFLGHSGWIKSLCYDKDRIISGSGDASIKIWDLKNDKCANTLRGHQAGITFVSCDPRSIVSSSVDKTLKWWDKATGKCVSTLTGHESYVKCHQFLDYALASGGGDCIRLWDMRSARCFRKFEGHQGGVHALQFDSSRLISGGRDGIINIYDLRTGTIRDYIKFESPITSLQFENDSLIFSMERSAPKMFDLAMKRDVQDFMGHDGNVRHLHFEEGVLATASFDGTVKLWSV